MADIIFEAFYGGKPKEINISQPLGSGNGVYHLYIDRFYQGQFIRTSSGWRYAPQRDDKSELTSDDIGIMIDLIQENEQK